jgi:HK97 family phage major capsid protein
MLNQLKALREQRGKVVKTMKDIIETAEKDKRALSDEESRQHGTLFDQTVTLADQIKAVERQIELDRETAATAESAERAASATRTGNANDARGAWEAAVAAAPAYLRGHLGGLDPLVETRRMTAFRRYFTAGEAAAYNGEGGEELRALEAQTDTQGGFIVAPQQFIAQLLKFVDDMLFIRGLATVIPVPSAASLGIPSLDTDVSDADWTAELATGEEDSDMAFGKRELRPHPLAKRIKVSQKLLRQAALNPEMIVRDRLAYKFGVTQEKAYLLGTGAQQPLGVFIASTDGISTARDVSTGNIGTDVRVDGLIEAKYTLKAQYWPRARWMFHRDGVKRIAKLKDGEGQYLWQPGIREGQPDRILQFPFDVSEHVPNTFTTGLYVGILADWSNYWIADALDMQLQRLVELYAVTNQVGFIGRLETDGMPVLEEAFVRVKLA